MSRSGYSDDDEDNRLGLWRGAVASAINGKRGQHALKELLTALDALPEKALAADSLIDEAGSYCTLGALGRARGMDLTTLDPEDYDAVAEAFGIAPAMAREIMYMNDEGVAWNDDPYRRWQKMREWVVEQLFAESPIPYGQNPAKLNNSTKP